MAFQPILFSGFTTGSSSGGGGGSPSIGGTVTGGTTGSVLFIGPGSTLAQDNANFNFNDTTHALTITGVLSASNISGSSSGTNTGDVTIGTANGLSIVGQVLSLGLSSTSTTGALSSTDWNTFNNKQAAGSYVLTSQIGAANGVASLDSGSKIPVAQLPSTVMIYKGAWDASTNTPTLADGVGTNGWVYRASVAGTQNLGSGPQTWAIGDFAIYNGTIWQHSPAADGVSSVNGFTGAVVLTQGNLTDVGTDGIVITGGTNAVWGSGTSIAQSQSSGSQNGFLSSTDWTTFNNKQPAFSGFTTDGVIYATSSSTVASTGVPTNNFTLVGNGSGTPPTWQQLNLTAGVQGTLPVGNGGTGQNSTFTQFGVTYASTATALSTTAAGSSGQVLTSNGTSAPTFQPLPASGANTALSNLASTAVNVDINPGSSGTINIGAFNNSYARVSSGIFQISNGSTALGNINTSQTLPDGNTANVAFSGNGGNAVGIFTQASGSPTPAIYIETGNTIGGSNNTGPIVLRTGAISTGTRGKIQFQDGTQGTAGQIWTSTDTIGSGSWVAAPSSGITALTGDVTASGSGSVAATLATVNTNVGSFGSSTSIPSFTVNAKGLITAASGNVVVAPAGTLSGTTLNSTVVTSSLTSVGTQASALNMGSHQINNVTDPTSPQDAATKNYIDTITTLSSLSLPGSQVTGNISGNAANVTGTVAIANGGTGQTSKSAAFDALSPMTTGGDIIYGGTSGTGTRLPNGSSGQVLQSNGGTSAPSWVTSSIIPAAWSGYHDNGYSWVDSSPSGSFHDVPNTGVGTFIELTNLNFGTVTTAASNLAGITFTPSASGITYVVSVIPQAFAAGANKSCTFRIWDGTTEIQRLGVTDVGSVAQSNNPITFTGLYTSVSTSPVTISIQDTGQSGSTPAIVSIDNSFSIQWCIHKL